MSDGGNSVLDKLKEPFYDAKSFASALLGGVTVKVCDFLLDYGGKMFTEYKQRRLEYKQKEEKKQAEVIGEKVVEELEKYFRGKQDSQEGPKE